MNLEITARLTEEFGKTDEFCPGIFLPGIVIKREQEYNGQWVMRINGEFIDRDTFRNDLLERLETKIKISIDI